MPLLQVWALSYVFICAVNVSAFVLTAYSCNKFIKNSLLKQNLGFHKSYFLLTASNCVVSVANLENVFYFSKHNLRNGRKSFKHQRP